MSESNGTTKVTTDKEGPVKEETRSLMQRGVDKIAEMVADATGISDAVKKRDQNMKDSLGD